MPIVWEWLDENQNEVRSERDTNGDGLPDRYGKMDSPRTPLLPLSVDLSWAVHPELIPESLRVPDQESRRVPIRRIPD